MEQEPQAPTRFERMLASMKENQAAVKTQAVTKSVVPPMGVGGTQTFIIQSARLEGKDTVFLQVFGNDVKVQLVLPPEVTRTMARQRDSLTNQTRKRAAQASAQERKDAGIEPAFLRKK